MLKVRNLEDIKLVKLDNTKLEDILEPIENEIEMLRSIRIFFFSSKWDKPIKEIVFPLPHLPDLQQHFAINYFISLQVIYFCIL